MEVKNKTQEKKKPEENIVKKPPVVVVLGHIDHGKTSLLNAIRNIEFTEGKPGGVITQHVGAYQVNWQGKQITFIDTPGHEAFSAIRTRGAKVADIAILVIDASEGVKPQTKEAIKLINQAGIPMFVALNKIDKPSARPEIVKNQLMELGVVVESFGGKIPCVEVSAKTKKGIDDLLDLIILVAEFQNLTADIKKPVVGVIIESYLNPKRGPQATLLLREGILRKGDFVATASTYGPARIIENFLGEDIDEVFPGQPAVIIGFREVPFLGEEVRSFKSLNEAKEYTENHKKDIKKSSNKTRPLEEDNKRVLNLIIKGDALGSVEAIEEVLKNLPQEKVLLSIIRAEAGEVNENDINLAKSVKGIILAFRVKTPKVVKAIAEREKIKILEFEVIYDLAKGVRELMEKKIEPEKIRVDLGKMEVLVIFFSRKNRQIVGGKVLEGEVEKGAKLEIYRNEKMIGQGRIISLQIQDVAKARKGAECAIMYQGDEKIKEKDILVIFKDEYKKENL